MTLILLGGPSGVGKSTVASQVCDNVERIQMKNFSDLMTKHLREVSSSQLVAKNTTPTQRQKARDLAMIDMKGIRGTTLVAGHFFLPLVNEDLNEIRSFELAITERIASDFKGFILMTASPETILKRRLQPARIVPGHRAILRIQLELAIEGALFDYYRALSGHPGIVVRNESLSHAVEEVIQFLMDIGLIEGNTTK